MTDPTAPTPPPKTYTEEFRRAAVGLMVAESARRLGVHPEVLRKWQRRHAAGAAPTAPDLAAASASRSASSRWAGAS